MMRECSYDFSDAPMNSTAASQAKTWPVEASVRTATVSKSRLPPTPLITHTHPYQQKVPTRGILVVFERNSGQSNQYLGLDLGKSTHLSTLIGRQWGRFGRMTVFWLFTNHLKNSEEELDTDDVQPLHEKDCYQMRSEIDLGLKIYVSISIIDQTVTYKEMCINIIKLCVTI